MLKFLEKYKMIIFVILATAVLALGSINIYQLTTEVNTLEQIIEEHEGEIQLIKGDTEQVMEVTVQMYGALDQTMNVQKQIIQYLQTQVLTVDQLNKILDELFRNKL